MSYKVGVTAAVLSSVIGLLLLKFYCFQAAGGLSILYYNEYVPVVIIICFLHTWLCTSRLAKHQKKDVGVKATRRWRSWCYVLIAILIPSLIGPITPGSGLNPLAMVFYIVALISCWLPLAENKTTHS